MYSISLPTHIHVTQGTLQTHSNHTSPHSFHMPNLATSCHVIPNTLQPHFYTCQHTPFYFHTWHKPLSIISIEFKPNPSQPFILLFRHKGGIFFGIFFLNLTIVFLTQLWFSLLHPTMVYSLLF